MNQDTVSWAMEAQGEVPLPLPTRLVLVALAAGHARRELPALLGMSATSVRRHYLRLEQAGLLDALAARMVPVP